jgi:hypothetical protein
MLKDKVNKTYGYNTIRRTYAIAALDQILRNIVVCERWQLLMLQMVHMGGHENDGIQEDPEQEGEQRRGLFGIRDREGFLKKAASRLNSACLATRQSLTVGSTGM